MISPVKIGELVSLTEKMRHPGTGRPHGGVAYGWDRKADEHNRPLSIDSNLIQALDCSGFVRYSAYKCSEERCLLPDGSYIQHQACENAELEHVRYSDVANDTTRLFIAFITPSAEEAGHVWWCYQARTMECHGGLGVDRRPWDTGVLLHNVAACYVFPSEE